jgi:hypothetical protein
MKDVFSCGRHKWASRITALVASGLLLSACAGPDSMLFVTQTNVGVGFNAASGNAHIGYDRPEFDVGPSYTAYGGLLPVTASNHSNLSLSNPQIKQFYATGNASLIATGAILPRQPVDQAAAERDPNLTARQRCALNLGCQWTDPSDRRVSVVGTNTHIGLSVDTKNAMLASVDFGYGRQEASLLPLRRTPGGDILPSALASISIDATASTQPQLNVAQFIATGAAAEAMAATPEIQDDFAAAATLSADNQVKSLAASLNVSSTDLDNLMAKGKNQFAQTSQMTDDLVQKLLGVAPGVDRPLTGDDKTKLLNAAQKLTDAADQTRATELSKLGSVAEVRKWLNDHATIMKKLSAV